MGSVYLPPTTADPCNVALCTRRADFEPSAGFARCSGLPGRNLGLRRTALRACTTQDRTGSTWGGGVGAIVEQRAAIFMRNPHGVWGSDGTWWGAFADARTMGLPDFAGIGSGRYRVAGVFHRRSVNCMSATMQPVRNPWRRSAYFRFGTPGTRNSQSPRARRFRTKSPENFSADSRCGPTTCRPTRRIRVIRQSGR